MSLYYSSENFRVFRGSVYSAVKAKKAPERGLAVILASLSSPRAGYVPVEGKTNPLVINTSCSTRERTLGVISFKILGDLKKLYSASQDPT